ncbi:MAG: gamma-carboxygeranoyl-CoA hydratase, partial [bacterium]|nr:gamma-carboxygeranoyl-CoA hydratase [bacterium]
MSDLINEVQDKLCLLTINRVNKRNAFDNHLLAEMQQHINAAINNPLVRVILLKA